MWTTILEITLLVVYVPVTLLFLMCGTLLEEPLIGTLSQWYEYRFCGYLGPVLGLLTLPCLFLAIWLRSRGKTRAAAWLRVAPLLAFAAMLLIAFLLDWICG